MDKQRILERTYFTVKYVFWTLYIIALLGVWSAAPKYLNIVDDMLKIVVGITLIYFFNPWTKTVCNNFHRKVVFTSAIALLLSSSVKSILQHLPYMKKVVV